MSLKIEEFCTGPLGNNAAILFDDETRDAMVFDPSFDPQPMVDFIQAHALNVETIMLTHGHFDHFAGVDDLITDLKIKPKLGMHRDDFELMRNGGGSKKFHMQITIPNDPDFFVEHQKILKFGKHDIEVRLTPGHTPGSVIYIIPELNYAVCGDLIFFHSVGRTDLPGGDQDVLMESIETQVFTLPPNMRLLPGHGEFTTVEEERDNNPFFNYSDY